MVVKPQDHTDVFSTLDRIYGLIDGSARWSDCLEVMIGFTGLQGCSLFLYDCGQGQSQLIESRGDGQRKNGAVNDASFNDFLWRSAPGTIWFSPENGGGFSIDPIRSGARSPNAKGYTVIDRDQTHILYLALSGRGSGQSFELAISTFLEGVLPHWHRACRLHRSIQNATLLQLVNPDRSLASGSGSLPIELRLRRRFRLSKAEARVAKLLAEGLAPRTIADRLHVSIHTVRSQLQSIFQKTDTCRQAELTSLLLRETEIPTAICRTQPQTPSPAQSMSIKNQERPPCL